MLTCVDKCGRFAWQCKSSSQLMMFRWAIFCIVSTIAPSLLTLLSAILIARPAIAQESEVVGEWKLSAFVRQGSGTATPQEVFGKHPTGDLLFTSDGRYYMIVLAEGRHTPKSDQDRSALYNTMIAHSGTYRTSGDKVIEHVELSWDASLIGTEQRVYVSRYDNTLVLDTQSAGSAISGEQAADTFTWERRQ